VVSSINYGEAWVHPVDGLDTNNGFGPDSPKRLIQAATGADLVNIGAGTHTLSSVGDVTTLKFFPGAHIFSNAPVQITVPANVISAQWRPADLAGVSAARITAPTSRSAFFHFGNAGDTSDRWGCHVRGLWLDLDKIDPLGGGVEFGAINQSYWQDCIGYRTAYGNRYLYRMVVTPDARDQSWNHLHRNTVWNAGLFYGTQGGQTLNRWSWRDNVDVADSGPATARMVNSTGTRHQGVLFEGNVLRNVTADCAAFFDRGKQFTVIGNPTDGIDNPNNIFFWADVNTTGPITSDITHCLGINANGGRIKLGASYLPPIGASGYESGNDNFYDVIDFLDNL
jgi:hypothetical protein